MGAPGLIAAGDRDALAAVLGTAGFISAEEEADVLLARADGDGERLATMVRRRLRGEPLAWITGSVHFGGVEVLVHPGVYVPRWHTELLVTHAVARLPDRGIAVDVCTGSGAVAKAIAAARPGARVVASDIDARASECARANGVEVYCGDLISPLPAALGHHVDVVVAVVPYVPTAELPLLQRDTFTFESPLAYDGGPDGTSVLRRVVRDSARLLRAGGALLLELGGPQADAIAGDLARSGFDDASVVVDDDGDVRGIEATWTG